MKRGRWALAAVSMILGIMLVSQYRVTRVLTQGDVNLQRAGDLTVQLATAEKEKDALQKQLDQLKKSKFRGMDSKEIERLKRQGGFTTVTGPGVNVTIDDSQIPVKKGENPNLYLIHDEDILRVVNELRAGGAEALSINGQRLIGTSEIRCAGPTITVNGKIFGPPFVVSAIGDPKTLSAALSMRGGVADSLKYWGINLKIEKDDHVIVPAYTGDIRDDLIKDSKGGANT